MSYEAEARALDSEILAAIAAWHRRGEELEERAFNDLALRIFAHQLRYNQPYARYCERLGVTPDSLPPSWEAIPAVPAPAFKEAAITTFDPAGAQLVFETSGTTAARSGRHYLESSALYDAALLAGFDRFVLQDDAALRYLNLVPNPQESPHSSLGYMMATSRAEPRRREDRLVPPGWPAALRFVVERSAGGRRAGACGLFSRNRVRAASTCSKRWKRRICAFAFRTGRA